MSERRARCPTCRARTVLATDASPEARTLFPFCSQRCQEVDLGRWLGEDYRVPGEAAQVEPQASADDE